MMYVSDGTECLLLWERKNLKICCYCCAVLCCVGVYMIAKATCTSIENWTNFRDCRTHNNFNEVKVFKLVLFSLFDKNIQYLVAAGISSNEIQMPFSWLLLPLSHCCRPCRSKAFIAREKKTSVWTTQTHTERMIAIERGRARGYI